MDPNIPLRKPLLRQSTELLLCDRNDTRGLNPPVPRHRGTSRTLYVEEIPDGGTLPSVGSLCPPPLFIDVCLSRTGDAKSGPRIFETETK